MNCIFRSKLRLMEFAIFGFLWTKRPKKTIMCSYKKKPETLLANRIFPLISKSSLCWLKNSLKSLIVFLTSPDTTNNCKQWSIKNQKRLKVIHWVIPILICLLKIWGKIIRSMRNNCRNSILGKKIQISKKHSLNTIF